MTWRGPGWRTSLAQVGALPSPRLAHFPRLVGLVRSCAHTCEGSAMLAPTHPHTHTHTHTLPSDWRMIRSSDQVLPLCPLILLGEVKLQINPHTVESVAP